MRFLLLPLAALYLSGCGNRAEVFRQESFVFGTRVEISIAGADSDKAEAAAQSVLARFDTLHRMLHAWQPSPLSQLNRAFSTGKQQPIDAALSAILQDARQLSQSGDELFNPAIGQLIALWGFHADLTQTRVPDQSAIAALIRAAPSMRNVHIENGMAWSDNPAVQIDLGGYAKGLALDEAATILRKHDIRHALINIGGNVMALGNNVSGARPHPWKIGIQHPRQPGVIATLELRDGEAIGTSGDYQRYFEVANRRYSHLIDPRTGFPAKDMQSVTVLVEGERAGVKSDVLSKPLFIAGSGTLDKTMKQLGLTRVLAVTADGRVLVSASMAQRIQWSTPQAFELVR